MLKVSFLLLCIFSLLNSLKKQTIKQQQQKPSLESLSSPLENTVMLLCAIIVCVRHSFRTQHKRLPMKGKEEELVPGTSRGCLSSPVRESCFPCHFLLQIFLILETSWMQVMISENPSPMWLLVL